MSIFQLEQQDVPVYLRLPLWDIFKYESPCIHDFWVESRLIGGDNEIGP